MKKQKLFATILASGVLFVISTSNVFAAIVTNPNPNDIGDFRKLLVNIINWLLGLTGVAATAIIIVGGYRWIASQGNSEGIEQGKKIIIGGIIGLIMIILAAVLVNTIIGVLGK